MTVSSADTAEHLLVEKTDALGSSQDVAPPEAAPPVLRPIGGGGRTASPCRTTVLAESRAARRARRRWALLGLSAIASTFIATICVLDTVH